MPVGEWAGEAQGFCFELSSDLSRVLEPTDQPQRRTREQSGSVNVLGGASKDSWVESAGSVRFRSVRPAGLGLGCFKSYSNYLKYCAKK